MSKRLCESALADVEGKAMRLPAYRRDAVGIGIVHLGIGAFHRAHQALYTEAVLNRCGGDWGICGVSLRRPAVRDQMLPQQCLYTSLEKLGEVRELQLVGAVREVLVAPEDPAAVITRIAAPGVHVVSLTVTEKGYCLDGSGQVDPYHPDILYDLEHPQTPLSAVGYLCAGLGERMESGAGPLTVISCDNLSGNGDKLRRAVLALAARQDATLARWIEDNSCFPNTMVDKIVPATSEEVLDEVEALLGLRDEAAVVGEPFRQWIIEDNFAGPVPPWNEVGASFVEAVAPFEAMKLKLLNASHSTIAYLACLAGWATVADAVAVPALEKLIRHMMRMEIEPSLEVPAGFDVRHYQQQLLQRFANTALQHRTRQIAMDGSQKLPQRVLPTLQWQLQRNGDCEVLCLGLAAWIRYTREPGLDDPLAGRFAHLHASAGPEPGQYLDALLGVEEVFPAELAARTELRGRLLENLTALEDIGAAALVERTAAGLAA